MSTTGAKCYFSELLPISPSFICPGVFVFQNVAYVSLLYLWNIWAELLTILLSMFLYYSLFCCPESIILYQWCKMAIWAAIMPVFHGLSILYDYVVHNIGSI